jgi:hypothetical protein
MAVPLFSHDTKQRAQYSHPDMELVYSSIVRTTNEGLTESQLAALECPQPWVPLPKRISTGSGSAAQVGRYIKSCQSSDHILKVDVGNKLQLGLIHENPSVAWK